ncbi:MAG: CocE/NonD family hydrolase [Trebonia sp.]|jgi:putative CocE/NonD family hydrolase
MGSRAFAAMLKIGPALNRDIAVERDVVVRAPDGTPLLTDAYLAEPRRPLPVILLRSPYGRRGAFGAMARLFAERGYHAVVQSTRGTFGSGGQIDFDREAGDGRAAADWIVGQPWSNGDLGTFGSSYLSFTQLALASTRPPQLKAMAIGIWAAERRAYNYPGGAFALDRALGWAFTIENQERPLGFIRTPLQVGRDLKPAFGHLPLINADTAAVGRPVGFYRDWLTHDQPGDPYWTPTDFRPVLADLGVPVTMIAGWYDMFLPYMLADYQRLRDGGQTVRLRVGAWHHTSQGLLRHSVADALDWFGTHLRGGQAPPAGRAAPVRAEIMGGVGWRELPSWPPEAAVQRWHLQPGGILATGTPPESDQDRYTYDPADPTPAVGGTSTMSFGPRDNRSLEQRPDVLSYTTPTLRGPLEITGPVAAELFVGSTRPHTDFFVRLCDVDEKGKSVNITDGISRLTDATQAPQRITVDLWPTAHRFAVGHRIRLQVSSGAHPRYARNPGSGEPLATAATLRTALQSVHHDPDRPSAVLLPVTGRQARAGLLEPKGPRDA